MIEYLYYLKVYIANQCGHSVGCSMLEINALEAKIGFELPCAYKKYLRLLGRDYNGILQGTDCFIDDVLANTEYLPGLLAENNIEYDLPENYLAFLCHQGYIIAWFALPKESENPICYMFGEGSLEQVTECGRIRAFMASLIRKNLSSSIKWWFLG